MTRFYEIGEQKVFDEMLSDDEVCCVGGSPTLIFLGSKLGKIMVVNVVENLKVQGITMLPSNASVDEMLSATALNCMIVLSASTLYYIEMSTLRILGSSIAKNFLTIAINNCPVVNDPFILQIALSTSNRQILICEKSDEELNIKHRLRTESDVNVLEYSKYCICFATKTAYYVYNIGNNSTQSLFPFEAGSLVPIIVTIDVEEFMINGMHGLGVFAKSDGVSTRPPLFWGHSNVKSLAYRSPYIFVLASSSLSIFSCDAAHELQRFNIDGHDILRNIDGEIVICTRNSIRVLHEIGCFDRASTLLENGKVDDAICLTEEIATRGIHNDYQISKVKEIRCRAVLLYFTAKQFSKCAQLAISSKINPRKILSCYRNFLPLPSKIDVDCSEKIDVVNLDDCDFLSDDYVNFLYEYIVLLKNECWTVDYGEDLDAIFVRLMSTRANLPDKSFMSLISHSCTSYDDNKEWLMANGKIDFLIGLALLLHLHSVAYELCQRAFADGRFHRELIDVCFESLSSIDDEHEFLKWFSLLLEVDHSSIVRKLYSTSVLVAIDPHKMICLLEPYSTELITYLELIKSREIEDYHTKLIMCYISEMNNILKFENSSESCLLTSYRHSLREMILESTLFNQQIVEEELHSSPFTVELMLLRGKKANSMQCLRVLLEEYKDFDTSELFCLRVYSSNQELLKYLIEFYLKNFRSYPEMESRVVKLLDRIENASDKMEIVNELPIDWTLSQMKAFTSKLVAETSNRLNVDKLKKSLLTSALRQTNVQASMAGRQCITIDDQTICKSCNLPINSSGFVLCKTSKRISHRSCFKNH